MRIDPANGRVEEGRGVRACRVGLAAAAVAAMLAGSSLGAGPRRVRPQPAAPLAGALSEPSTSESSDEVTQLEQDIVNRMTRRAETPPGELARLDLGIDLRLISRWLLTTNVDGKKHPELLAAVRLKGALFRQLTDEYEQAIPAGAQPNKTQMDALTGLHQFTFNLPELKSGKDLDDACTRVGWLLAGASSDGIDARTLPAMRPEKKKPWSGTATTSPATTPAGLADQIRQLNISGSLRQQMLTMAAQAEAMGKDPQKAKEAGALTEMLSGVMELAGGLASNTAVSPESRMRIEAQLLEGLVLFTDPRTRAMGRSRMDGLKDYRQILGRVNHLNLPDATRQQLAPVFAWAQQNGDTGAKVLGAIDRFARLQARHEARDKKPSVMMALRKPIMDVDKQYETDAAAFPGLAVSVAQGGASATPGDLEARADSMAKSLDLIEKLEQVPRVLEVLGRFHPRPQGALERRAAAAAAALTATGTSPGAVAQRAEAVRFLDDVFALNRLALDLGDASLKEGGADVAREYTLGQAEAFDARWRGMVEALASQVAGGAPADHTKVDTLGAAVGLCKAIRQAAAAEKTITGADALSRWVDWRHSPATLIKMIGPCRQAMGGAFAGFAKDGELPAGWARTRQKYQPLIGLLGDLAGYREACEMLPTGLKGTLAAFITPMDGAPFSSLRTISNLVEQWASFDAASDDVAAGKVIDDLSGRLDKGSATE